MTSSFLPAEPTLPYHIERVFRPLCRALLPEDITALRISVREYMTKTNSALARNEFTDTATAEQIAALLSLLFDEYGNAPEEQRALIVGAARYFVLATDAEPDLSLFGFEDDALVLNYVLEQTGHSELRITL